MNDVVPILELRGVSKSFGAVQALYQVDFHVAPGEVMALVGDNGAGKSTLIKCIAGIYPFDEGEVVFDGEMVNIHGPKDAARLGIEVVYQDLALADNLDVVQNMYLGRELADGAPAARRDDDGGQGAGDADGPVGDHAQLGPPDGGRAVRWPAAVGGRRQGRDVELARGASSTSRPPRSAWRRRARSSTSSSGSASRASR